MIHTTSHNPAFVQALEGLAANPAPPSTHPDDLLPRLRRMTESSGAISPRDLERILGGSDLLDINYLRKGLLAARPVCRVELPVTSGGGYGTGFLVGPNLLLTNHHVLTSPQQAARARAQFDFELDLHGLRQPGTRFRFSPAALFLTNEGLDATLVAVEAQSEDTRVPLSTYGFLRFNPQTGKIEPGESVTIIGHPNGEYKQVAVRENRLLKVGDSARGRDDLLWYTTDTLAGNSGSPVFNDQWQVVALHHAGVPETVEEGGQRRYRLRDGRTIPPEDLERYRDDDLKWVANEGIRVSRIVAWLEGESANWPLLPPWLEDLRRIRPYPGADLEEDIVSPPPTPVVAEVAPEAASLPEAARRRPLAFYQGREGYRPDFLGVDLPLPDVPPETRQRLGQVAPVNGGEELKYTHFSVVMNADRRLAYFTAVNIDGRQSRTPARGRDRWYYDPRLPDGLQVGDELYSDEPGEHGWFDRGHLVRRLDPVWGDGAALANDDTFHWTNCSPQYWAFNQGDTLWQGLENFILHNTDAENLCATVLTGPVFGEDDETHRGVKIPQAFWKVVAVVDGAGKLSASAYLVSQQAYARNIPFERLPVGPHRSFQLPVAGLQGELGLTFAPALHAADVWAGQTEPRPLSSLADVYHPRRTDGP